MKRRVDGAHAGRCWAAYLKLIVPVRARARELGYAIGQHGSIQRDIDLIAVPWTDAAVPARELAEALRATIAQAVGAAYPDPHSAGDAYFRAGKPGAKPHGRLCWSWFLDPDGGTDGPYVDLSVMPLTDPPFDDRPLLDDATLAAAPPG